MGGASRDHRGTILEEYAKYLFLYPFLWITILDEPVPLLKEEGRTVGHGNRRRREEEEEHYSDEGDCDGDGGSRDDDGGDGGGDDSGGGLGPNVGELRFPHKRWHVEI